jgi:superfamily II DNA or RNA helicase
MGVGKSKIFSDAINYIMSTNKKDSILACKLPIIILVNSRYLRDKELPLELKKWGCNHKVKIVCYQTACRWKDKDIGLLLADELDYAITEKEAYLKSFTANNYKYFLGLTGTMIPEKYEKAVTVFNSYPFYKYSLEQAQIDGVLNKLMIWVHEVPLSTERSDEAPYGEVFKYKWIQSKIDDIKNQIGDQYREILNLKRAGADSRKVEEEITKLSNFKRYWESSPKNCNSRMSMMRSTKSLIEYAKLLKTNILNFNEKNKVLIFSQLTKDVNLITDNRFHGESPDPSIVDSFNRGEIRDLGVIRKVHRGVNFVGLNNCIVQSYTSSHTDAQQAYIGRMVRLPSDQIGHIHFLVSYYIEDGIKIYCHNASWLGQVLNNVELKHIRKQLTFQKV